MNNEEPCLGPVQLRAIGAQAIGGHNCVLARYRGAGQSMSASRNKVEQIQSVNYVFFLATLLKMMIIKCQQDRHDSGRNTKRGDMQQADVSAVRDKKVTIK